MPPGETHRNTRILGLSLLPVLLFPIVLAAGFAVRVDPASAQVQEQSATYVSQIDEDLTIRRISLLPVIDNVDGIYARPIESQLISLVKASHRWDFVESNLAGTVPTPSELEESPAEVEKLSRTLEADAFLSAIASRGPNGLSLKLNLFLKKDGKLLVQETLRDHPRSDLNELKEQVRILYGRLLSKIPYEGLVMSRQQNRVTVNLGRSDGLVKDQIVTAVQIIGVNRHPKFNFIVSSDKEILGRIKILKVDETLSFGAIVSEKEKGAIKKFTKVSGLDQITYPVPDSLDAPAEGSIGDRKDSAVTFGKDPKEWLPVRPPSFGMIGIRFGLGSYDSSVNLGSAGTFDARSSFSPSLGVNGELWLNPNWIVRAELAQGVLSTSNPRSGSSPSNLNHSMSRYSLSLAYNFLLRDDFFGPKFTLSAGFMSYRMFVDDSTPTALTTTTYSGVVIGLGGLFPITEEKVWYAGAQFNLVLMPKLSETPGATGASSKNTINDFSLSVERKIAENIRIVGAIHYSLFSTTFTGQGTRTGPSGPETGTSLSQKHAQVSAGLNYMF